MFFKWLKQYMPRSLYGRAALILVLPIVTVQIVVTVVFIQRHFEDVTEQMTRSMALELGLVLDEYEATGASRTAGPLEIALEPLGAAPFETRARWYDLTGGYLTSELKAALPQVKKIDLPSGALVRLLFDTERGPLVLSFDRRRVSARNPHQLLVYMAGFGILMTLISFIYLRNQLRPIKRLAKAAAAFGRGQAIDYKPSGAVEVRQAGSAFLDMRSRIERHIEQRTLMLSGVSHDLRTPLTRMKLQLSLLDDAERAPLEKDVREMQRLVDVFLSFAEGASGSEPEKTDVGAFLRDIVEDCARSGMDVSLGEMEGAGEMLLRRVGLRRALENLIGNATRYGEKAVVSMALTEKALRISVEDDGPGIAPELRQEALKPFARLDKARNQNKGSGVGLGLAIAMDVARAHGGALRLGESEDMGGLKADIVIGR